MATVVLAVALTVGTELSSWGGAAQAGAPTSPSPAPFASPVDPRADPRDQVPPPATAVPTPAGWPGRTAEEVALNVGRDPFVTSIMRELVVPGAPAYDARAAAPLALGVPTYIKGFEQHLHDTWLVPVVSGTEVVGAFSAPILPDGRAVAGSYSGFSGPFPHPLPMGDALARGSVSYDAAVSAELVWTTLGARQGIVNGSTNRFWMVVRESGATVLIFSDGRVMAAEDLH